jgi:hypothetical protein
MTNELPPEIISALLELRQAFLRNGLKPYQLKLEKINPESVRKMKDFETGKLIEPDFITELPERTYGIKLIIGH